MIYLQLRVKMPDEALWPFLRDLESWQRGLQPEELALTGAAIVLEATGLTREQVAAIFDQLARPIPYRQVRDSPLAEGWEGEGVTG